MLFTRHYMLFTRHYMLFLSTGNVLRITILSRIYFSAGFFASILANTVISAYLEYELSSVIGQL